MGDSDNSDSTDNSGYDSNSSSSSSSSSSSFGDLQRAFMAERKRLRRNRISADGMAVLETSSSSADSSPAVTRRRTVPLPLSDSDVIDSSDEESALVEAQEEQPHSARSPVYVFSSSTNRPGSRILLAQGEGCSSQTVLSDSDSGGESTEKCPICLRGLKSQEVGSPEGCDHTFCFTCLHKWSQSCNRCPMDRLPFSIILVRENVNGQVVRQMQVTERDLAVPYDFLDNVFCRVCRGFNNEERMLLCDCCDQGYHMDCLTPPLTQIPTGSWFCPLCSRGNSVVISEGNVFNPYATRTSRARPVLMDAAPPELVEYVVITPRVRATRSARSSAPSTSRASQSVRSRPKKRKTKKRRRVRRSTTQTSTVLVESQDGNVAEETVVVKKCVYRRKKKKSRKSVKKRPKPVKKVRTSIIPALRRHWSRTIGCPLLASTSSRSSSRSRVGVSASASRNTSLSIFENRYQLAPVSSDSEMDGVGGEVALLTHRRLNLSTRTLERSKAIELFNAPIPARPAPMPCEDRADLLASILESQSLWHSKNTSATVKSDGKVELRPKDNSVDVRNAKVERTATAAPVFPESESHSAGLQSRNEDFGGVAETSSQGTSGDTAGSSSSRMAAPINDREGYRNFLNNIPTGPTPICRTGSPLRFRMPVRPQLRRIPLLPRKPPRGASGNEDGENGDKKRDDEKHSEEECGLYSDIEVNAERDTDNIDGQVIKPTLTSQRSDDAHDPDAYDPAEPCDSDEEVTVTKSGSSPVKQSNDNECPVFSLYSSDSVAFSHKDEEERATLTEKMAQQEANAPTSSTVSIIHDNLDGDAKRSPSASPVAPRRRHSSSSSQSSSPGTPRRLRDQPKESNRRAYRKRSSSSERETVKKTDAKKQPNKLSMGLEGLDVEAVSSGNELEDDRLSSLSLSGVSSRHSSPVAAKKSRRKKPARDRSRSGRCASEEGEIDSDKDKRKKRSDENKSDLDKKRRDRSNSTSPSRQVLGSKENKKELSWKKPSRGDKKFRNSRKTGKEKDRKRKRDSPSPSPKRDKRKSKERKKTDKKKEIERYDVRKVVKVKQVDKKDEFGRNVKSRSVSSASSKSRSWSRNRSGTRRSRSRSPSPSRRGRRRGRFRSNSPPRDNRKRMKSVEKDNRKSRRSRSRKRSASPPKKREEKKNLAARRSWSRSSVSSGARSPVRKRRSVTPPRRRRSKSWSRGRSPTLQNLTVVVKPKDKKKRKSSRSEKKKPDSKKKKTGNSKEVFASGDNVLVSVNFSKSSKSNSTAAIPLVAPVRLVTKRRKRSAEETTEKSNKSTSSVSKTVVDAALAAQPPKRKKLTRLTEEDAEKILNQKPVAVIDLDESPYREQTPSPINVVVVSDSGSGDEAKAPAPQLPRTEDVVAVTPSPATVPAALSGPKTPPEPPLKFSIAKATHIRPIANPLADEEEEEGEETEEEPAVVAEGHKEKPAEPVVDSQLHKGPNTPLSTPPRGPSTPKTPPSPQSSPDAYDPFKPTQSPTNNTTSDLHTAKESPTVAEPAVELTPAVSTADEQPKPEDNEDGNKEVVEIVDLTENAPPAAAAASSESIEATGQQPRKTTPQPVTPTVGNALLLFPMRSPSKTPNRPQNAVTTAAVAAAAAASVTGIQRLQHRLGSPVNKTPNSVKSTPEKRPPELLSVANVKIHNANKRNGPLQDTTNEPIDMDDSPYSPATSEGDDLFEPPSAPIGQFKPVKPSGKTVDKFNLLFGTGSMSPIRNGSKKNHKAAKIPKPSPIKHVKKTPSKKNIAAKMDEDQLRILDEVPSSAVELQVKDKFLKKLNRQERVVDEVKTVLKPFYAAKRVNKEEYKDILRRAVPKICHSKSGEINPSKIKHLVEAYVRKCALKKKSSSSGQKPKLKKTTMFS